MSRCPCRCVGSPLNGPQTLVECQQKSAPVYLYIAFVPRAKGRSGDAHPYIQWHSLKSDCEQCKCRVQCVVVVRYTVESDAKCECAYYKHLSKVQCCCRYPLMTITMLVATIYWWWWRRRRRRQDPTIWFAPLYHPSQKSVQFPFNLNRRSGKDDVDGESQLFQLHSDYRTNSHPPPPRIAHASFAMKMCGVDYTRATGFKCCDNYNNCTSGIWKSAEKLKREVLHSKTSLRLVVLDAFLW